MNTYRIRLTLTDGTEKLKLIQIAGGKGAAAKEFTRQQNLPLFKRDGNGGRYQVGYFQPKGNFVVEDLEVGGPPAKGMPAAAVEELTPIPVE